MLVSITERDLAQNADGTLQRDGRLNTVIECALTTKGRAHPEDRLQDPADLGGWWGDAYPDVPGRTVGSRLWTLWGLHMSEALPLAPGIAKDALKFLIDDGFVDRVDVEAFAVTPVMIGLRVGVVEPGQKLVKWLDIWQISIG